MTELFLDIETAQIYKNAEEYNAIKEKFDKGELLIQGNKNEHWKFQKGALNPFEGKVVAITYAIDGNEKVILKEWESSEKEILAEFYNVLKGLEWPVKIIGVNISGFDIPFLHERMRKLGIDSEIWLYKSLRSAFQMDLIQMHLPVNDFNGKGISHNNICAAYGCPVKENKGATISDLYYNGKYQEILGYIEQEFVHTKLFKTIKEKGIVSKEDFQKILNLSKGG